MMIRFLAPLVLLALALGGGADIISFQDPSTGDNAYCAQVFEEAHDDLNLYQMDDLDLGDDGYYLGSAITYWLYGVVEPQYYHLRTYSALPDSCDTDQYFMKEYCGVSGEYNDQGRWVVTFDLEGDVYSGVIWIAGYVRADFEEHGLDAWWNANAENLGYEPNGSEEYVWRWGQVGHGPCWPIPGSWVYFETADLSWKIEGTPVPEPWLVCPLALAGLGVWHTLTRGRK